MKAKNIVLFFLLFAGYVNVAGQNTLLIVPVDVNAIQFNPHVDLTEKEALIIIRSVCPFTFDSNVDKDENIVIMKTEQRNDSTFYAIKLSAPSRARRLRMISSEYETITQQLGDLQPGETRRFIVNDPASPFIKALKAGITVFDQGKYEQAKVKFHEALAIAFSPEEKKEATTQVERADFCIDAKTKAERYFSNKQWFDASREYQKVIGANLLDAYCQEKYEQCLNGDRKITGTVTNRQGQPVSGVSIVFEEQKIDKKGNIKYSWSKKVAKTNSDGKFEVEAWMKTQKLQYWLFSYRKNEIGIPGDTNVIDLVVNDGRTLSEGSKSSNNSNVRAVRGTR